MKRKYDEKEKKRKRINMKKKEYPGFGEGSEHARRKLFELVAKGLSLPRSNNNY